MKLLKVTITGADNNVDPQELIKISKKFPFVEWGLLFSKGRVNTSRYPIKHYGYILSMLAEEQDADIHLSAHICGEWTREFFMGDFTFANTLHPLEYPDIFSRVQLNFNSTTYKYDLIKTREILQNHYFTQFIFQHNKSNLKLCNEILMSTEIGKLENIHFLYDSSGGRGTSRSEWPHPIKGHLTGYAGGLNPINLEEQLKLIETVTEENEEIWIDVETGVRDTKDNLDLSKVVKFLEIASKFVMGGLCAP